MTRQADPSYAALAGLVGRGEWTTYGDIALAAHGRPGYARHVGWAAARVAGFPHAQRVLASGGRVAAGWTGEHGEGPAECQRRLEAEGVLFHGERADPARHVGWEELLRRADAAGVGRAPVIGYRASRGGGTSRGRGTGRVRACDAGHRFGRPRAAATTS